MDKTVYMCTGTCKAEISEEQYAGGLTACGADGCTHLAQPFEKRQKCDTCGQYYEEGSSHTHD